MATQLGASPTGVQPSQEIAYESHNGKGVTPHSNLAETSSDGYRADEEKFQPGVQRVRAITEIWSKQTMIIMFILYAFMLRQYVNQTLLTYGKPLFNRVCCLYAKRN